MQRAKDNVLVIARQIIPAPALITRLLLLVTLALAAGGLILPESPAYAQSGKKQGKKSGKKKSSKRKSSKRKSSKKRAARKKAAKKKAAKMVQEPAAATPAPTPAPPTPAPAAPAVTQGDDGADGAPAAGQAQGGADSSMDAAAEGTADIDSLRQEYLTLRDELFRSRARAATVASAMYSTRLQVNLTYGSSRLYSVTRAIVRLDGASVFDDASGAIANDPAPRFEGFVAPGRHLLTVRIEATGKDDERFTTAVENTFTIQAPAGKDVTVTIKAKDDGDMAYAWQKKERGSYKPSLSISVTTTKRAGPKAAPKADKTARTKAPTGQRTAEAGNGR